MICFVFFVSLFVGLSGSAEPSTGYHDESQGLSGGIMLPRERDMFVLSPYRVESTILFEDGTSVLSFVFVSFDDRIETAVARLSSQERLDTRMTTSFNFTSSTGEYVTVPISIELPSANHEAFWANPPIFVSFTKSSNITEYVHSLFLTRYTVVLNPQPTQPARGFFPITVPDSSSYMVQSNAQIITRDGRPTKTSRALITDRQHIAEINPSYRMTSLPSTLWRELLEELGSLGELGEYESFPRLFTSKPITNGLLRLELRLNSAHDDVFSLGMDAMEFLSPLSEVSGKIIYGLNIRENRESDKIVIGYDLLQSQSMRFDTQTGQVSFAW